MDDNVILGCYFLLCCRPPHFSKIKNIFMNTQYHQSLISQNLIIKIYQNIFIFKLIQRVNSLHLMNTSTCTTTYPYTSLTYFFSYSQLIDYQLGLHYNLSLQAILSSLQQVNFGLDKVLSLFSYIFKKQASQVENKRKQSFFEQKQNDSKNKRKLTVDDAKIKQILDNDGLRLVYTLIDNLINKFQTVEHFKIEDEMILKSLLNTFYILIHWIQSQNQSQSIKKPKKTSQIKIIKGSQHLHNFYKEIHIDSFLIKLLTLSLQVHYIPIKKITMIYTKILSNIFSFQESTDDHNIIINPIQIFNDQVLPKLPVENTLEENYLEKLKINFPPLNELPRNNIGVNKRHFQPIEQFYRTNNIGDCPLAQSIVVGLLRSLLTICNSQNHKKFTTVKGAGVDSFRQWQLSYRYLIQNQSLTQHLSPYALGMLKSYQQFNQSTTQKTQPQPTNPTFHEFYLHKIYTTSIITNFFILILLGLKQNCFIQFSYFLQLISDANGILVFLKFLTDKFVNLQEINDKAVVFCLEKENVDQNDDNSIRFKDKVMLTVYSILNMLHTSCNNYPEKIKNYLFQYNSYVTFLIIKKIPVLFFPSQKTNNKANISTNSQAISKKDDLQGSLPNLPSKQELEEILSTEKLEQTSSPMIASGQKPSVIKRSAQSPIIIRRLTQICYDLLKIQIPYFSKKSKDTNNMKMLIDIYCRFPKTVEPIQRTWLQKLQLKCRNKKHLQTIHGLSTSKPITSVQDMKTMHNQYNNLYYWSNDFVNQLQEGKSSEKEIKDEKKQKSPSRENEKKSVSRETDKSANRKQEWEIGPDFDYEEWLEDNLWRYYD